MSIKISECIECQYRDKCIKFRTEYEAKVNELIYDINRMGYTIDDLLMVAKRVKEERDKE